MANVHGSYPLSFTPAGQAKKDFDAYRVFRGLVALVASAFTHHERARQKFNRLSQSPIPMVVLRRRNLTSLPLG